LACTPVSGRAGGAAGPARRGRMPAALVRSVAAASAGPLKT